MGGAPGERMPDRRDTRFRIIDYRFFSAPE